MLFSRAGGKIIHEKTWSKTSSDTVPLSGGNGAAAGLSHTGGREGGAMNPAFLPAPYKLACLAHVTIIYFVE